MQLGQAQFLEAGAAELVLGVIQADPDPHVVHFRLILIAHTARHGHVFVTVAVAEVQRAGADTGLGVVDGNVQLGPGAGQGGALGGHPVRLDLGIAVVVAAHQRHRHALAGIQIGGQGPVLPYLQRGRAIEHGDLRLGRQGDIVRAGVDDFRVHQRAVDFIEQATRRGQGQRFAVKQRKAGVQQFFGGQAHMVDHPHFGGADPHDAGCGIGLLGRFRA
ncbi:hypothetical protein D3C73_1148220 [compost metagenome]